MASLAASRPLDVDKRAAYAAAVRARVCEAAAGAPRGTAVLLSGGVDSQAVIRALGRLGKEPVAVSFRREDREPRDWVIARDTAERLGHPFVDCLLPTDLDALLAYVREAVTRFGLRKKTAIECFWPRWIALAQIKLAGIPAAATGDGGDGYHGLSKRAMIHYRDSVSDMDGFRRWYFGREDWSQTQTIAEFAARLGLEVYLPLGGLIDLFMGFSWGEVNLPKQKVLIRDAFQVPDSMPNHQNLQLGDSGIADLFAELAAREGASSPVALYNRLARETEEPPLF